MLVSKKAISYLIPNILKINDELIIKAFNNSGCEVERVIKHEKVNNLVIGKILSVENHPNANKLHVCSVQLDEQGTKHTIVCGASNLQIGKYVIVALQGAKMVDGRVIQYKELRGMLSQGMICAYSELTTCIDFLSKEEAQNIILLDDATIGDTDIYKYINLDDTIYDLSLPSNRNDLNSIYSICQELNGYFDLGFKNKVLEHSFDIQKQIHVELSKQVNGVSFLKAENINVDQSSWQIKSFLMNNGIIPTNSLIDNLALISLYTNASIVAYDYEKVGDSIFVELCKESTSCVIDGKKLTINSNDLIIRNKNNVIGLAGVCPFDEYRVTQNTKHVLLEIGNYDYRVIRSSMVRLNLSHANGKRLTKQTSNWHILQALGLMSKVLTNCSFSKLYEQLSIESERKIKVDFADANAFLGTHLSEQDIKAGLVKYGFSFECDEIIVPSYRTEVQIWQDVYEEILKLADIDKIKGLPIKTEIVLNDINTEFNKLSELKQLMNNNYFTETKTYNLVSQKSLDTFNVFHITDYIKIANPLNSNREYFRTNIIESLLEVFKYNSSYKNKLQPVFEIQKIYTKSKTFINITALTENIICLDKINKSNIIYNVDSLKSIINSIANAFNTKFDYFASKSSDFFYSDEMLSIYCCGQLIGFVGRLRQSKLHSYDLNDKPIYAFTLNLNLLFDLYKPASHRVQYTNKLIPVYKDVSYITVINANTLSIIEELKDLPFISSFEFIDVYPINDEKCSYTIRLYFNNDKKLTSNEIDECMKQVHYCLTKLHCEVRK